MQQDTLTFRQNVIECTNLYSEFWSQAMESQPDLTKLCRIAFKIQAAADAIQADYRSQQSAEVVMPSIMRTYAAYLKEVANNSAESDKVLRQLAQILRAQSQAGLGLSSQSLDAAQDPLPVVYISLGTFDAFSVLRPVPQPLQITSQGGWAKRGWRPSSSISRSQLARD